VAPAKEMDFVSKSLEQSKIRAEMYKRVGTAKSGGAEAGEAAAGGAEAAPESN